MRAKFTLTCVALVVAIASVAAIHARPPTDEPLVKSSVTPGKPKWADDSNWGKIPHLYPHRGGVYFRLGGGQTMMEPQQGYYFLKTSHPNYQAMCDLLYKTGEKRWKIGVGTQHELDKNGFAVVEYMVVNFPADD